MEIERKYLVKYLPENLESYPHNEIAQGYISVSPVIRIRRSDERYILTVKSSGFLCREEFETEMTADEFKKLSCKVEGNVISKTRYKIPLPGNLTAELDIFHDDFEGLVYVEVEFSDVPSAEAFQIPDFFGRELTEEAGYSNSDLSSMKKEDIKPFIEKNMN